MLTPELFRTICRHITLCALAALPLAANAQNASSETTFTFGTPTSPEGKTITVDSKGFLFNGIHTLPVMGEIHYSRVPASEWAREIRKMKAGGITILATYVFWSHHQPSMHQWD